MKREAYMFQLTETPKVSPGCRNADTHNLYQESSKFHFISHKKNIALNARAVPVDLCTISPQDGGGMYPSPGADAIT